jgi:hypothetical protein
MISREAGTSERLMMNILPEVTALYFTGLISDVL